MARGDQPDHHDDDAVVLVRRMHLETALEAITIAYENAVAGADAGEIDFEPFDGLLSAIGTLRAALQARASSGAGHHER